MKKSLRAVALTSVTALVAALVAPAQADELQPAGPGDWGVQVPDVERPPQLAAGVIVKYKDGVAARALRSAAAEALGGTVAATEVAVGVRAFQTEPGPVAEFEEAAAALEERPEVEWAEPNVIREAAQNPWPVPVNDPQAPQLRNVWDSRPATDPNVTTLGVSPWPNGGYSTKAPAMWGATTGGVVVAVVDSGITAHPDLAPNLVAGYDMITNPTTSNDGDGRDADPSDPGDGSPAGFCTGAPARNSSWHGTHVAGTIGAVRDNGEGVVGVAPGVRIQPVRVLGRCGGTDADIVAGVLWAAGVPVPGLPANPTPARIINLSLGGSGACPSHFNDAFGRARTAGATMVVSLGNSASDAAGYAPGNCPGVIGVHATSGYGDHAEYSNFGAVADVSAPGGDFRYGETEGILSTVDAGTAGPVGPSYGWKHGTSMAAPAVAGVAAMISSLGQFTPESLEGAVRAAVAPFPTATHAAFLPCDTARCGTGIIDASTVPMPTAAPTISGGAAVGSTLTAVPGSWAGAAAATAFTWYADGRPVGNGPTYVLTAADGGAQVTVRQHVAAGPFTPIGADSTAVSFPKPKPAPTKGKKKRVRTKIKILKVSKANRATLRVIVKAKGKKRPQGTVKIKKLRGGKLLGKTKVKRKHKGRVRLRLKPLARGKWHHIRVVFKGRGRGMRSNERWRIRYAKRRR